MDEEDIFVVIIGDDKSIPNPLVSPHKEIKSEPIPADEIRQKILEYGEVISCEDLLLNLKQELEEHEDIFEDSDKKLHVLKQELEEYEDIYEDNDGDVQNHNNNYSQYSDCDSSTHEEPYVETSDPKFDDGINSKISVVQKLRNQYPDWGQDELVIALKELMQNVKAPPLPDVYYTVSDPPGFYNCIVCPKQLESLAAAGRHYEERHGPRYRKCFGCSASFRSRTNLYKHEKLSCGGAGAGAVLRARELFLSRGAPERPYMQKDGGLRNENRRYACSECPADFLSKVQLQAHTNLHRGLRPYACRLCPNAYTSRSGLKSHMVQHSDTKFVCDLCGREFKKKDCLINHLNTHLPQKKFPCGECSKRYASKFALSLHVRRVHRRLPPPCACHVCGRRYDKMSMLRDHMKTKHEMDLITRNMFMKALPSLAALPARAAPAQVVRSWAAPPPPPPPPPPPAPRAAPRPRLQCSQCDKTYLHRQDLRWHERSHAAPPARVQCDVCHRFYARVSILRKHLKAAHGMIMMSHKKFLKSLPKLVEIKAEILHCGQTVPLVASEVTALDAS